MRWRVITLTDCGVSRGASARRVAVWVWRVVYEPVPSVVALRSALADTVTGASVALSAAGATGAGPAGAVTGAAGAACTSV